MKVLVRSGISGLMAALLTSFLTVSVANAADDDAAKFKELERAMAASQEGPAPKKPRTRAIVFDNEPQSGPNAAESAKAVSSAPQDCTSVSPDAKMVAVDFAIQFNVASSTVSSASEPTLTQIAKILALSPDRCVLVEGHTDATGNADKNLTLSRDRASSVVNFIAERNGIDRKRLVPMGKGSSDPLKNLDPRDPKNRRVVFKVVTG